MSFDNLYEILIEQVIFGSVLFFLTYFIQLLLKRTSYCHYSSFIWFSYFVVLTLPLQSFFKNIVPAKMKTITYVNFPLPQVTRKIVPVLEQGWDPLSQKSLMVYWFLGAVLFLITILFIPLLKQKHFSKQLIKSSRVRNDLLPQDMVFKRPINLYISECTSLPFVFGIFKPSIIIPKELIGELTPLQLRAVIFHEVAHVLNKDLLKILVARIVMSLFWFFPLTYWAYVKMREAQEFMADELPLEKLSNNFKDYGESLLKISQLNLVHQEVVFGMSILNKHHLTRRLEMIMQLKKFKKKSIFIPTIILIALVITSIFFIGIEGKRKSGPYVTINAIVKKDGAVIARTSIITIVGQRAVIKSYSKGEGSLVYGSVLKMLPVFDGKAIEVEGSVCYDRMTGVTYENDIPVNMKFSCAEEAVFKVRSEKYEKVVEIKIPGKDIDVELTLFEGARTQVFLDNFSPTLEEGKDKPVSIGYIEDDSSIAQLKKIKHKMRRLFKKKDDQPEFVKEKIKEIVEEKYKGKNAEFKKNKIEKTIAFQLGDGEVVDRFFIKQQPEPYIEIMDGDGDSMKIIKIKKAPADEDFYKKNAKTVEKLKKFLREEMTYSKEIVEGQHLDERDYIQRSVQLLLSDKKLTSY